MGVDPEGRFWWLLPPAAGIALGLIADYVEEHNCKCQDGYDLMIEGGVAGGIRGGFGPYVKKPRMGIAGGGRSREWTSAWSTAVGKSGRTVGRVVSRASAAIGLGLAAYDLYRIYFCLGGGADDS